MSQFTSRIIAFVLLSTAWAEAQSWNPNQVYFAGEPGAPNTLRYIDDNGVNFPGWRTNDTQGIITNQSPAENPAGIGGLMGNFIRIVADPLDGKTGSKQKHLTNKTGTGHDWVFNGASSTRTALFWRIYIPSSPPVDKFPSIQIRTHNRRHHLDFKPNAGGTCTGGGGPPQSGWVDAEDATITSGGWRRSDGGLYLPMSMDAWHTIRVEVHANGQYEAWIDEELGLSDVNHITAVATKTGSGDYIEIGRRSSESESGVTQYWTNYLAWGQHIQNGANEIAPVPTGTPEICYNGIDDDGDGLADCADSACPCVFSPENTVAACTNANDDDGDGQADCDDPDCAGLSVCDENAPEYVLSLVRQVGSWQSSFDTNTGFGTSKIYFSVYDENGQHLDNVTISDPCNGVSVVTGTDLEQGQSGHARYPAAGVLMARSYRFHVSNDQGAGPVASEATPELVVDIGPHAPFYVWQVEFMRKSRHGLAVETTPTEPLYTFDDVILNTRPGPNTTINNDSASLQGPGGVVMGQTFTVPQGLNRIISARAETAIGFGLGTFQYQISVHPVLHNPPSNLATDIGPAIGAVNLSPPAMLDGAWWGHNQLWPLSGPDSIPVEAGNTYFLKLVRVDGGTGAPMFNAYRTLNDYYPGGQAFRSADGLTLIPESGDLVAVIVGAAAGRICLNPVFDVTGSAGQPDGRVDQQDLFAFEECATGPTPPAGVFESLSEACQCMDWNEDGAVDQQDFGVFQRCYSGSQEADRACDN